VVATNNNLRNIIALQDLGEAQLSGLADNEVVVLDLFQQVLHFLRQGWIATIITTYNPELIQAGGGWNP
jgi:hypothetical protein